jgi:type II secretory pathway predicted ATPase ExeA
MMSAHKQLLARFELKWNPFAPNIPKEAIWVPARLAYFGRRVVRLCRDGGFVLISGGHGTGKSVGLRYLDDQLAEPEDVVVGNLERPQASVTDFYRELGHLFGVSLSPCNRWGGFKALRERWTEHIDSTLCRPVLMIDEAQLLQAATIAELRLLASADFDTKATLTVILCGDQRLLERLRSEELSPVASRIRVRLITEPLPREQLVEYLRFAIEKAGNPSLMTAGLIDTLAEHALGNLRSLAIMGAELLDLAAERDLKQLDEGLFLDTSGPHPKRGTEGSKSPGRKAR